MDSIEGEGVMIHRVLDGMIGFFGADVRRINHALKVYGFAMAIGGACGLKDSETETLSCAAVLHDVGIKPAEEKYRSSAGSYQEIEGPPVARRILEGLGTPEDITGRVCHIIGRHHSYTKIDGIDFQILVEADFLVNIFEDGMSAEAVESVRKKVFKTEAGLRLLDEMYPAS
jgi:HD superfamily phosphodiesterase